MKCIVQWVDSQGNITPDDNEAVCLVQCFDPRRLSLTTGKFEIPVDFNFRAEVEKYFRVDGDCIVPEIGYGLPCCEQHLKRMGAFWRALPLHNQPEAEWHQRVKNQATPIVLESIIRNFPRRAEEILKKLRYNHLYICWSFDLDGIFVGVEKDGYIHS